MRSTETPSVIWVGPRGSEAFRDVEAELLLHGLSLAVCETADDLADTLRSKPRAVFVVRDGKNCKVLADAALTALESLYHAVPVVVLADESAFGRYYELMRRGVRHYYELSEAPKRIADAVRHTAAHAA